MSSASYSPLTTILQVLTTAVLVCMPYPGTARAADGQFEISQALIPFNITNAGSYIFTESVTGQAGGNGITIRTNNVRIDLDGFTLQGVPGSLHGIETTTGLFSIAIMNGTIAHWGLHGIDAFNSENSVCDNIIAHNNFSNGIFYGLSAIISDCHSFSNGESGIQVENGSVVRNCFAWDNGEHGIDVHSGSTVEDCQVWRNGHDGIHGSHAVTVSRTISDRNYGEGIEVDTGGRIMDSVARFNRDDGIKAQGEGCLIIRCLAEGNEDDGFDLAYGCSVRDSVSVSNGDEGIRLSSNSMAVANTSVSNTSGAGIKAVGTGNRIERNLSRANKRGIQVQAERNFIIGNIVRDNSSADYDIDADNVFRVITTPGTNMPDDPWINFQL